jgi:hypothetical protein
VRGEISAQPPAGQARGSRVGHPGAHRNTGVAIEGGTTLKYAPHTRIDLRKHPDFNEAWLQERIAEAPTILGLGDLSLVERERAQGKAGRLDLLLADPEESRRFEVELMLGPTDPDHVIRTIEYWDIERRRYPAYDHIAVLVAEDITSRFLNVLSLMSGSIPLIAIQLKALEVEGCIVLDFVRVLDQTELRTDDTDESSRGEPTNRAYWEQRSSPEVLAIADGVVAALQGVSKRSYSLNFTRSFIGLTDGARSRNFIVFLPRRKRMLVVVKISDHGAWSARLDEAELAQLTERDGRLRVTLTAAAMQTHGALVAELVRAAAREYEE